MFMRKPKKGKTSSSSYGCKASNFNYIMFYLRNNSDEATTSGNYLFIFNFYRKTAPAVWMQASTCNETSSLPSSSLPPCNIGINLFHILLNQTCYLLDPICIKYKLLSTTHSVTTSLKTLLVSNHPVKNISVKSTICLKLSSVTQ